MVLVEATRPKYCNSCARMHESQEYSGPEYRQTTIRTIVATDTGWKASGIGQGRCQTPWCGVVLEAITREIPLHLSTFECPKCRAADGLNYNVTRIETSDESFEFEVDISCKRCSGRKSVKSLLKTLLDVVKVRIGPDGISVEKS